MGLSALDDVVMTAGYLNADNEMYSCVDFEVSTSGEEFDVELTGGKADSRLVIKITDSAEGGDMVIISLSRTSPQCSTRRDNHCSCRDDTCR